MWSSSTTARRRAPLSMLLGGIGLAAIALVLTLLIQLLGGGLRGSAVGLGLTALLYLGWGVGLAALLNKLAAPAAVAPEAPPASEARRTLLVERGSLGADGQGR